MTPAAPDGSTLHRLQPVTRFTPTPRCHPSPGGGSGGGERTPGPAGGPLAPRGRAGAGRRPLPSLGADWPLRGRPGAAALARPLTHPEPGRALPGAAQCTARRHHSRRGGGRGVAVRPGGGGPPAAPDSALGVPGSASVPAGRAFPHGAAAESPVCRRACGGSLGAPRRVPSRLGAAGGATGKVRPGAPRGRGRVGAARRRQRDGAGPGGSGADPSPQRAGEWPRRGAEARCLTWERHKGARNDTRGRLRSAP